MRVWTLALAGLLWMATASYGAYAQDGGAVYTIGFPQDTMANDWRHAQVMAVNEALAAHDNVDFIFTDARGSTAKNIQDIEDMVDLGIDLLMVSPRDSRAMTPVIAQVHAKGIPVVLLTRRITTDDYTTFVSASDAKIAENAAHFIAENLNGAGRVLVLQGVPTATTAIQRTDGFMNTIRDYTDIEVAGVYPANYLRSDAIKVMESVLAQGVAFDAIYAQSDSMAAGARLALEGAGIDPASILIVGIDYIAEAREAIRQGQQDATFTYPTAGSEAAEAAVKILNGEPVPREIEVPSQMVTKDNVDDVETVF